MLNKKDILVRIADISAARAYTNFGKFSRYLFAMGMHKFAQDTKSPMLHRAKKLAENCRNTVDFQTLKMLGFSGSYATRELNPDTFVSAYLQNLKKVFKTRIKENRDVSPEEKLVFMKAMTLMSKSSDLAASGKVSLSKFAWSVGDSLGKVFDEINNGVSSPDEIPVSKDAIETFYSQWRTAAKVLTGSASFNPIPTIVLQEAKSSPKKSQAVNDYQEARKRLKEYLDIALRNLTRKEPMDVDSAAKVLKSLGFLVLPFPTKTDGFVGKVGIDSGKVTLYTDEGIQLSGGIAAGSTVRLNPKYNSETLSGYYCEAKAPNAVVYTRIYALQKSISNQKQKHESIKNSAKDVKKWLSIWTRDMRSKDPLRYIPATVACIIYETGARVGSSTENRSQKGAEQTFGILSLRRKHVKILATKIVFNYVGKKGMQQLHTIPSTSDNWKQIKTNLQKIVADIQSTEELLWGYYNSANVKKQISYPIFSSYIKTTGLQKIHSLRNIRGTSIVEDLMGRKPFKPTKNATLSVTQREADKYMSDIITEAGILLGHKTNKKDGTTVTAWKTTAKSYIQPSLMADFFKSQKLKVPTWVPKELAE
jgi:hypothetical protein